MATVSDKYCDMSMFTKFMTLVKRPGKYRVVVRLLLALGQPGGRKIWNLILAFGCKTGAMCLLFHFLSVSHL